ncbi:hypothetical protein YN1HA_27360 [Sulfurisphaera ohwakuensis]
MPDTLKTFFLVLRFNLELITPLPINVNSEVRAEIIPISLSLKLNMYLVTRGIVVINILLDALIAIVKGIIINNA